jgi:hypothetical protein
MDQEGEYALLVDIVAQGGSPLRPLPSRDPQRNMMIDPSRNMMIDPTRNMMIDPNRNMMIDPSRNMMIDPRRNYQIDPRRNWLIDPRRNTAWDGPYLYALSGEVAGFIVRANDKVALLFDNQANFVGPLIPARDNFNLFDEGGRWIGYFVPNGREGYNQFDLSGRWGGYVVGSILTQ